MKWIDSITGAAKSLLDVICPDVCTVCGERLVNGEEVLCINCLLHMPVTGIHSGGNTELHQRLASTHYYTDRAAAMMWYYRDSDYARLIHDAKYNHRPRVARTLAAMYARQLTGCGFFDGIDVIIPVPLHFSRLISRGYNQAEVIARAISSVTGIKVKDNIVCRRAHSTQTRKGVAARDANAREAYSIIRPGELDGLHVLLIDDVITTGATLRACLDLIAANCTASRTSVLTLAAARMQ
ncbi:MAG: ComF family protein [Bacteroides sp.]|nr:ComF family protein [Barnesiella sp.]MBD5368715.1 ComF family protein [Bacteroides sp.]